MKLSLDRLARTIGRSRAEFYSFYAPSWATPAGLEALRRELADGHPSAASEPRRSPKVHALRRRSYRATAPLPHAA